MGLLKSEVQEILQNPTKKAYISKAIRQEKRLDFHVNTNMEVFGVSGYKQEFLKWVEKLLPKDKYQTFLSLFNFPIQTNELTEQIYMTLEKVYDGKDAFKQYNFLSDDYLTDWVNYRTETLKAEKFWRNDAFNFSKTKPNGFIVVDLKESQQTKKPEPYFYFTPMEEAFDFGFTSKGELTYFVKYIDENLVAVFDDESYRVFKVNDKKDLVGDAIIENAHDLGYCPVSFFWNESVSASKVSTKKTPLTNQLANLDWLLFYQTSKKHLDLYASYPIYSGYQQDCDYENNQTGHHCENGFIKDVSGSYLHHHDGQLQKCPVCSDSRLAGVGSMISVPTPNRDNDFSDLRNPIQITTIDKDSLDYNVSELERLEQKIYEAVVGRGGEMTLNKAFNTDQVSSNTESRRNVLFSFKKNLELIESWTDDTICKLRYGNVYIDNTISYGTDWYLYTAEELREKYKNAKEAGATDYELDILQNQIIETENRNNPKGLQRAKILMNLEPYRHQTRDEVMEMMGKGFGNKELIAVKLNFSTFVMKFERENTNVLEFGNLLEFDKKIEVILNQLIDYGRSEYITEPTGGDDTGAN